MLLTAPQVQRGVFWVPRGWDPVGPPIHHQTGSIQLPPTPRHGGLGAGLRPRQEISQGPAAESGWWEWGPRRLP